MNDSTQPRITGILLAAGAGSRFSAEAGAKLLHPLDGVAIAARAVRNLRSAGLPVTAVVRPDSDALIALLEKEGCTVTVCANAADGMGVSLAHAIGAARDAAGWIVALADMPRILPATINRVANAIANGALIAAPRYHNERGHPVGFSPRLLDELLALTGDEGARAVVKRHQQEVQLIDVNDAGALYDVDSRADLEH